MRTFAFLFAGVLAAGLVAEGAYIVKLRRQMGALERKVDSLRNEAATDDFAAPPVARRPPSLPLLAAPAAGAWSRPAPQPAAAVAEGSGDTLPLPAVLSSPDAREQLHKFVAAELARERDEQREQWLGRRNEAEQRFRERIVKELGLNTDEAFRVGEILSSVQSGRRDLLEAVRSGEKQPQEIEPELRALRDKAQASLKDMLGDERTAKLQEIRRQERGPNTRGPFPPGAGFGAPGAGPPR